MTFQADDVGDEGRSGQLYLATADDTIANNVILRCFKFSNSDQSHARESSLPKFDVSSGTILAILTELMITG